MKEFQTLTIRNLDSPENAEIVKIMNDIINATNYKTGQDIFTYAIREFRNKSNYISAMNLQHNQDCNSYEKRIKDLEFELDNFKKFFESYKVMQNNFNNLLNQ